MREIFVPIKGYEGLYEVSNTGRVISLERYDTLGRHKKQKEMRQHTTNNGYKSLRLCKNGKCADFLVHHLVADAFVKNPNAYTMINHKDENKKNNNAENLEWCTQQYNNEYGTARFRQARTKGRKVAQYDVEGNFICDYYGIAEAARRTGVSMGSISESLNKKKPTNGFVWKDTQEVKCYA